MTLLLLLPPLTAATTEPQDKKKIRSTFTNASAKLHVQNGNSPLHAEVCVWWLQSLCTCSTVGPWTAAQRFLVLEQMLLAWGVRLHVTAMKQLPAPLIWQNILASSSLCIRRKPGCPSACTWTQQSYGVLHHSPTKAPVSTSWGLYFPWSWDIPCMWFLKSQDWISYFKLNSHLSHSSACSLHFMSFSRTFD